VTTRRPLSAKRLHYLTNIIVRKLKPGLVTRRERPMAVVLLDAEKAFDSIKHHGLFYKLSILEFSSNVIKLIS
jgi:hypothetical protein